ncbi:MAG: hypothetical protein ABSH28_05295 [Acidobacteriota bacterium]|jgi:hypothetical protein
MKWTSFAAAVLIWIGSAAPVAVCASPEKLSAPQTTPPSSSVSAQSKSELTDIVKNILTQSGWEGKEVTIVGYYRGWDLLKETNQAPPVTRSDWVIKDNSGAIYVQSKSVDIKGQDLLGAGKQLRPSEKESVNRIVRVTGVVRVTGQKQPYIEPKSIELVK